MPVRKESTIKKDENPAYVRSARGFTPFRALKPTSQVLEYNKRGEVKGNQRRRLDTELAPDRFDEVGTLGRGIAVVLRLVAIAHADVIKEEFRHLGATRQIGQNLRPSKGAIGKSREEGDSVSEISFPPQEHSETASRCLNDCARIGVVADAFATCKPNLRDGISRVIVRSLPFP